MKLSSRIGLTIALLSIIFVVTTSTILTYQIRETVELQHLTQDTAPALQGLQHLLATVYKEHVIINQYLETQTYADARALDAQLEHSAHICEQITIEIDEKILSGVVQDTEVIRLYKEGLIHYNALQNTKSDLTASHKERLATGYSSLSEQEIKDNYEMLFQETSSAFEESTVHLHSLIIDAQKALITKQKQTIRLLIYLIIGMIVVCIAAWYVLVRQLIHPIEHIQQRLKEFSAGRHSSKLRTGTRITELIHLENLLNNVFSVISKEKIQQKLLPTQYSQILTFIKDQESLGNAVSFKDVKKEFHLTYPTVKSRIGYLEKQGHITVDQQGREKIISRSQ